MPQTRPAQKRRYRECDGDTCPRDRALRAGEHTMVKTLLDNNSRWASDVRARDAGFFSRLAEQQQPKYLWIGCADSRVPANQIVGLDPGEVFVHRNVSNLALPTDMNFLSVLQYALEVLKVRVVVVCGHDRCGGVIAADRPGERLGLIDHWLEPVRDVARNHVEELNVLEGDARTTRLAELNVLSQVENLRRNPFVKDALSRGQPLEVDGLIYSLHDGLLRQLT
jgi:carbonic anhydrase